MIKSNKRNEFAKKEFASSGEKLPMDGKRYFFMNDYVCLQPFISNLDKDAVKNKWHDLAMVSLFSYYY